MRECEGGGGAVRALARCFFAVSAVTAKPRFCGLAVFFLRGLEGGGLHPWDFLGGKPPPSRGAGVWIFFWDFWGFKDHHRWSKVPNFGFNGLKSSKLA